MMQSESADILAWRSFDSPTLLSEGASLQLSQPKNLVFLGRICQTRLSLQEKHHVPLYLSHYVFQFLFETMLSMYYRSQLR